MPDSLTEQRTEMLLTWVKLKHCGQIKKYTGKPYYKHLLAVAQMAKHVTYMGYEIGLCHDLLEDTDTTKNELLDTLVSFSYTSPEADYITQIVVELTDVYIRNAYPGLSRDVLKEREAARHLTMSPGAQTVKYCDLIDNIPPVVKHEPKHAAEYLKKKRWLISGMDAGDALTRQKALSLIDHSLRFL